MYKKIVFTTLQAMHNLLYTGRTGNGKCCGIEISTSGSRLQIAPVTIQGKTAKCDIELPLDRAVIEQVKAALDEVLTTLPPADGQEFEDEMAANEEPPSGPSEKTDPTLLAWHRYQEAE